MTGLFRDRPTNVLKNGSLFARWTTGNRNHVVFATMSTLTEFYSSSPVTGERKRKIWKMAVFGNERLCFRGKEKIRFLLG